MSSIGKVRIYGCGGCGIKLALPFANMEPKAIGEAEVVVSLVDTSRSDVPEGLTIRDEQAFFLEGADGSGQIRSANAQNISANIKHIISKFQPEDLNIVVFSNVGGSGSVFGPFIMKELLSRGYPTVGIVIGAHGSLTQVKNAMNTMMSLDKMTRALKVPFVMAYESNQDNTNLEVVDQNVWFVIKKLLVLASRQNKGLDTQDVANFLRFDKVTGIEPQIGVLDVVNTVSEVGEIPYPVAIASIAHERTTVGQIGADYQTDGLADKAVELGDTGQVHFVINVNSVDDMVKSISSKLEELRERSESRPRTASFSNDVEADDDLMIY